MRTPRNAIVLLALLSCPLAGYQKPGSVEGSVLNSVTGAPVKKALVTLRSEAAHAGYQAVTDTAGRFRFENVQPEKYALCAEAQNFVGTIPDASRAASPTLLVTVTEGKAVKDVAIRIEPYGALAGKVTDENGEPVRGATVSAERYAYSKSGKKLYGGATMLEATNDRGEFRVFNVPPGRWYLAVEKNVPAVKAAGRTHGAIVTPSYGQTYYPGVHREAEATPIDLDPGAELTNLDIRLNPVRTFHVRGKVIDARTGQPAPQGRVHIDDSWYTTVRGDGTFDLSSMTTGNHILVADVSGADRMYSTVERLAVTDRDINGLVFRLEAPIVLHGAALLEGVPATAMPNTRVSLEPVGGLFSGASSRVGADGSLTFANLAPQIYRVTVDAKGVYLKGIQFGNQDASAEARIEVLPGGGPLTLSFAKDAAQVQGVIQTPATGPTPIRVTLIPEGSLAGRPDLLKTVDPDDDNGSFQIEGIAPGEYKVFAWELHDLEWAEYAEFRKLLEAKAASITLSAGEHKTVQLTVITAAEVAAARRRLP